MAKRVLLVVGFLAVLAFSCYLMQLLVDSTETPLPSPTALLQWSPQLNAPSDGFQTYPTNIHLEWAWPTLGENQLYSVRLWREGQAPGDIAWTGESQLEISGFLESNPPGHFYWQVGVIQLDEVGNFMGMASGWSPVGEFERIPPTPLPTSTPEPTSIPVTPTPDPKFVLPNPYNAPPNDVEALMDIRSGEEALAKRQLLVDMIWGEGYFPEQKLPVLVQRNLQDPNFAGLPNLKQIDRLSIVMEFGIKSYPYVFYPIESNGEFMIYHQGSDGEFVLGIDTIRFLVEHGYTVMAFAMPLLGQNNRPIIDIPHIGRVRMPGYLHYHVHYLEPLIEHGIALKLFIEPVIVGLNYAQRLGFEHYYMMGISGGGWTTHMAAAIDPRIERSYPVAGSVPEYQRFDGHAIYTDLMAYVQMLPRLSPTFNYLELYLLGAFGQNRKELMVINQFDRCCFWGVRYLDWFPTVQARMEQLGAGEFEVFLDSTHTEHIISPAALGVILNDLQAYSAEN